MNKIEFERVAPEEVGISSEHIMQLLDDLGPSVTEMHSIIIMRQGKICAEGWWTPYAPGVRHGLQSHTKTYAATAVGIACQEGLVRLDEKIIDIFPEFAPKKISENLASLTVHHVLCMGCGMETMPKPTKDWIKEFLATPVVYKPGTTYMYNSTGSTLLVAIVNKRSKMSLTDYLKPRLFDKIGIDSDNLKWLYMPDKTEVGGGGLYATTEDNLRLIKLYADKGVCNGERILDEEYVRLATSLQNHSATEEKGNPDAKDNFVGYGYQLWMCRPDGVYRADGAMGQFTIVSPKHDLIIAVTETAQGAHWAQNTLDMIWRFLDKVDADCAYLQKSTATKLLQARLNTLSIPSPKYAPYSPFISVINNKKYCCTSGDISFGMTTGLWMSGADIGKGIKAIMFSFMTGECKINVQQNDENYVLFAATDGSRRYNSMSLPNTVESQLYLSASWTKPNTLCITARWVETCFEKHLIFCFDTNGKNAVITQEPITFLFAPKSEENIIFTAEN